MAPLATTWSHSKASDSTHARALAAASHQWKKWRVPVR